MMFQLECLSIMNLIETKESFVRPSFSFFFFHFFDSYIYFFQLREVDYFP